MTQNGRVPMYSAGRTATVRRGVAALVPALLVAATLMVVVPARGVGAAPSGDECFVRESYSVFLGRQPHQHPSIPDAAELTEWVAAFAGGTPRSALPGELAGSDEWLGVEVDKLYQDALDRAPDPGGRAYWIGRLAAGALVNEVGASIYGSDEFYARAGGTPADFVTDLYARILGRVPDAGGLAYWAGQVARLGRGRVAGSFFGSVESRTQRVTGLYHQVLGRAPDVGGLTYWVGRLATVNDVRLAVLLASSSEFYNRAQAVGACAPLTRVTYGNTHAHDPSVSAQGDVVAFSSAASNIVAGDTNGYTDVFVWFGSVGATIRIGDGNQASVEPSVSADGGTVVFTSLASNLVPGDTNGMADVFSYDVATAVTTRVTDGDAISSGASVSADGGTVVFTSLASNLVPGDTNGVADVFSWDRATGVTTRITHGDGASYGASVSADGATVAFESDATDLVPGDTNGVTDIYRWERGSGSTFRVTYGNGPSTDPAVSGDGRTIVFSTAATDMPGSFDYNGALDVYYWDRTAATIHQVTWGDDASARPSVSADGNTIVFDSEASDTIGGHTNTTTNVYVFDRTSGLVQLTDGDAPSYGASVSPDGSTVVFESDATDLTPGDIAGYTDVFLVGTARSVW